MKTRGRMWTSFGMKQSYSMSVKLLKESGKKQEPCTFRRHWPRNSKTFLSDLKKSFSTRIEDIYQSPSYHPKDGGLEFSARNTFQNC